MIACVWPDVIMLHMVYHKTSKANTTKTNTTPRSYHADIMFNIL